MRLCTVNGCERKLQAKGLCGTHYSYTRKGLTVEQVLNGEKPKKPDPQNVCNFKSCKEEVDGTLFCKEHQMVINKNIKQERLSKKGVCKYHGCENKTDNGVVCTEHEEEFKKLAKMLEAITLF